jgi:hypothetical protein
MTYSGAYGDYLTAYGDTVAQINDLISSVWIRNTPSLPTIYIRRPVQPVLAPHIDVRSCKPFFGHKFQLGGSKK